MGDHFESESVVFGNRERALVTFTSLRAVNHQTRKFGNGGRCGVLVKFRRLREAV